MISPPTSLRTSHLFVFLLPLLLSFFLIPAASVLAQEPNLLQNPGFERPYIPYPGKENCRIAAGWVAYWFEGSPEEVTQGYRHAPEYKAAFRSDYPGNRVRSGELAQQYFRSFANFRGGVYQQVPNIPIGAKLRFELWGMTWSCDKEEKGNCGGATSGDPSPMRFRIGIDPYGGVDALSPNIVWSPEQNAYDSWHYFQVDAVARNSWVTVFVYAYPEYRSQDNNVYLDDASLVIIAPPPTNTPRPTNTPTKTPTPTNTPAPTNTPTSTNTPTNTPVPPTATPTSTNTTTHTVTQTFTPTLTATSTRLPTNTPTATLTPIPTATPTPTPGGIAGLVQAISAQGVEPTLLLLVIVVAALLIGILIGQRLSQRR